MEDTGSRMFRIGKSELVFGELLTVDEILGAFEPSRSTTCGQSPKPFSALSRPWPSSAPSIPTGIRRLGPRLAALRVAVLGAGGRMGGGLRRCREADGSSSSRRSTWVDRDAVAAGAEVIVDFTTPGRPRSRARGGLPGLHAVVGTSGFDEARLDQVRTCLAQRAP